MKRLIIISLLITLGTSCIDSSKDESKTNSKYCANQIALISGNDSLPKLKIDFNRDGKSSMNEIEEKLNITVCDKPVYFSISYDLTKKKQTNSDNSISLRVFVSDYCENDPAFIRRRSIFQILMNLNNDLLIEGNFGNTDSILAQLPNYYLETEIGVNYKNKYITLQWDIQTDNTMLEQLFSSIIEGYLVSADKYAFKNFSKQVCELNEDEIENIYNEFPFRLKLAFRTGRASQLLFPDQLIKEEE